MKTINIAKDFSITPGGRYKKDGPFSGEEFREKFLEPYFKEIKSNLKLKIILDGVEGFATAFLDGAFGELARHYGKKKCLKTLKFISEEDPSLIDEIIYYIENCDE